MSSHLATSRWPALCLGGLLSVTLAARAGEGEQDWRRLFVVAHRGASSLAPENTLAAARAAAQVGAKAWEFDVRLTGDGEVVLLHDENFLRTSNIREVFPDRAEQGPAAFTLEELRRLDVGGWFTPDPKWADMASPAPGERIATLAEALALSKELGLFPVIELKETGNGLPEKAVAVLREGGWNTLDGPLCVVISFHEDALRRVRALETDLMLLPLYGGDKAPDNLVDRCRDLGAVGVDIAHPLVTEELVGQLHEAALAIAVWTVDDPARMRELVALDPWIYITTNVPQLALDLPREP